MAKTLRGSAKEGSDEGVTLNVKVKYYLWLTSKTGVTEDVYVLPDNASIKDLLWEIAKTRRELGDLIEKVLGGKSELVILLNSKHPHKGLETPLHDNDVVELLPPVSGG